MDPNQNPQPQPPEQDQPPYGVLPSQNPYLAGNNPVNPAPGTPGIVPPAPAPQPQVGGAAGGPKTSDNFARKRKMIIIGSAFVAVIIIIVAIIVALVLIGQKPKKVALAPPPPKLCYVRVAMLYCVNDAGVDPVRYTIPQLPQSARVSQLVANSDQSEFLAVSNTAVSTNQIWILGPSLQQEQQLTLPSGDSAQTPSWSRDGQSVLLEIDGAQNTRQIERYNIATGQLQQLTTSGYNTQPYETKNGDILYSYFSGQGNGGFAPYIMESDGSNPQPLGNLTTLKQIYGFSYDPPTDTIFVFGVNGQGQPSIVYGTTTDFLDGRVVQTLVAPVHPGDNISYINKNTIIVQHNDYATILSLAQNTPSKTVHNFGPLVGMLSTAKFQKNPQQTEQKYDRIINLNGQPPDFEGFIKGVFDTGDAKCAANQTALADGEEYSIVIYSVVSDSYASVSQGCGQDNQLNYYYAKNSAGNWTLAFQTQSIPGCAIVNKYNFTTDIIAQCIDPANGLIVTNNPQTDTQKNN